MKKMGTGSGGGDGVPLGAILPLAHNSTIPAGYLLCDGAAYSRTMFPDLFAAIGTTYGAGDGSTTFNVPDYNAAKRFAQGDTVAGTVKNAGLPNIEGSATNQSNRGFIHSNGIVSGALKKGDNMGTVGIGSTTETNYALAFDASLSNSIYGASNTVQPPALTARYIIKAFDGQTPDSALIDITQYANELAGKATRSLDNLSADGENHFLDNDFTIIYPNGGSEDSPANVTINSRYVESNPFPGYRVNCLAELLINSKWGGAGDFIYTNDGQGSKALQLNDDTIVLQTGGAALTNQSVHTGNPFGITSAVTGPTPCRIKVWKVGKIPD
jgi:microcystin-dependent protein